MLEIHIQQLALANIAEVLAIQQTHLLKLRTFSAIQFALRSEIILISMLEKRINLMLIFFILLGSVIPTINPKFSKHYYYKNKTISILSHTRTAVLFCSVFFNLFVITRAIFILSS